MTDRGNKDQRTFVIGDIHGAYQALQQVIERAEVTESDQLIFLGDFVDGWSQSFEVIQYLVGLEQRMKCVFIKGNHDLWCQHWLEKKIHNETWLFNGGRATFKSYHHQSETDKLIHLQFFQRMLNYYIDDENRLFIHAGFSSLHGPYMEHYSSNYSWDRTLWEMALCMDKRIKKESVLYPKRLKLFNEIYIGHTPTLRFDNFEPMNAVNVWNIDTGAAFNGRLSILEVHTKQFWQSDVVQNLYPDEPGRNRD
ncbi:MAG: serine/threonine protein phosphatase [Ferruginibacter sp.]|nr:serine/threonine protein phosphatase [Ferruginibacter sp.]